MQLITKESYTSKKEICTSKYHLPDQTDDDWIIPVTAICGILLFFGIAVLIAVGLSQHDNRNDGNGYRNDSSKGSEYYCHHWRRYNN